MLKVGGRANSLYVPFARARMSGIEACDQRLRARPAYQQYFRPAADVSGRKS